MPSTFEQGYYATEGDLNISCQNGENENNDWGNFPLAERHLTIIQSIIEVKNYTLRECASSHLVKFSSFDYRRNKKHFKSQTFKYIDEEHSLITENETLRIYIYIYIYIYKMYRCYGSLVGLGCRIHRLNLFREVRLLQGVILNNLTVRFR